MSRDPTILVRKKQNAASKHRCKALAAPHLACGAHALRPVVAFDVGEREQIVDNRRSHVAAHDFSVNFSNAGFRN